MGENVLAYQFVAGLIEPLKLKLVGIKGTFDELLTKARFEEARLKERMRSNNSSRQATQTGASNREASSREPVSWNSSIRAPSATSQSKSERRCYSCGGVGHIARHCSLKGRGAPVESKGRDAHKTGGNKQVSMLQAEVDPGTEHSDPGPEASTEGQSKEMTVSDNCDKVVADAISQVMATMYGVEASNDRATLGPTPTTEVLLDGSPIRALLDTGSPTSIVSLDFFLKTVAKKRTSEQTPAEWGKSVQARLQPTTMTLRSYGGDELNIVSQVQCHVTRGDREVDALLQVQKDAPVDLLLGTDVLSQLGFALIQTRRQHSDDLLIHSADAPEDSLPTQETGKKLKQTSPLSDLVLPTFPSTRPKTNMVSVKLIQAVRLPGRHSKLVQADVQDADTAGTTLLFQPDLSILETRGISMPDTVTLGKTVALLVSNFSCEPVQLDGGEVLGQLEPVSVMITDSDTEKSAGSRVEDKGAVGDVAAIQSTSSDRKECLLAALRIDKISLPDTQREQLVALVLDFANTFALDHRELGCTSVVTHKIDTGEQLPIRQAPQRVPFSLRNKVRELMGEMLEQGVIRPSSSPWASPIVLVAKKDGSTRFCLDYRKLNAITKPDVFPLPRIDDSLDLVSWYQVFLNPRPSCGVLASGNGRRVCRENSIYNPRRAFRVHGHALWSVQRSGDLSAVNGERTRRPC